MKGSWELLVRWEMGSKSAEPALMGTGAFQTPGTVSFYLCVVPLLPIMVAQGAVLTERMSEASISVLLGGLLAGGGSLHHLEGREEGRGKW